MTVTRWPELPGMADVSHNDSLAILGEAAIKTNAQVHQLSVMSLLPQLIPAPQALIRTSRPTELKPSIGKVIGSRSGGIRDFVQHIAHLLHSHDALEDYNVRCERITKPNLKANVSANRFGPLAINSAIGFAMSVALVTISAIRGDGFGLLATILLSLLSTLIGIGSRWKLKLKKRSSTRDLPEDRIVVNYPNGSFRIIICTEEVARELYWHPETCHYVFGDEIYRFICLICTLTLMIGVVCLGNASLDLQVAFGASYLILNVAYWTVAALPKQWHWDLSCYKVERIHYEGGEENKSFTTALWKAIAITGNVEWVKNGRIAPVSAGWNRWVDEAGEAAWRGEEDVKKESTRSSESDGRSAEVHEVRPLPKWDPEKALDEALKNPHSTNGAV